MANLLGQNIGTNYKGILNLNTLNGNLSGTLQAVTDGDGNTSPLTLSTGEVGISRTIALSAGSSNVRLINETYTINNSGAQTGTATGIFLNATETALNGMAHNLMDLQVGGSSRFRVLSSGDVIQTNSLYITNSGQFVSASRFRGPNAFFQLSEGGVNGTALFTDSAGTSFNRLNFGGTTNAFPAIKRNGAAIDFRLADDSAFCSISINSLDAASNLQLGAAGNIRFAGITKIQSPSSGVITLGNDSFTDFSRLQLGGTTNSFPAIKRNGAQIDFRLADDSGFANIRTGQNSIIGLVTIDTNGSGRGRASGLEQIAGTSGAGGVRIVSTADTALVDASAQLQVDSTSRGFLPPRLTTAQRDLIATPAAGLMIYNTSTNRPNFYDGSAWVAL